jgi:hypothetical protein
VTALTAAVRVLVVACFGLAGLHYDRGMATRFGDPGDLMAGAHLSCTHQKLKPGQLACAHRTLPCGTILMLENPRTHRFAMCEVLDRGPWWARLPSGQWGMKMSRREPGSWRGDLDLAPAVADALGHNGLEHIRIFYQQVAHHLGRHAAR